MLLVLIIFSIIISITSNQFSWWNPAILNMLYNLIQFIMYTIRGNCLIIWKIIHLHLVCNICKSSVPIRLHKCVNTMSKLISPCLKLMKYGIFKILWLYSKITSFPILYYIFWNLQILKCVSQQFQKFKFTQHLISSYMDLVYYNYNYN